METDEIENGNRKQKRKSKRLKWSSEIKHHNYYCVSTVCIQMYTYVGNFYAYLAYEALLCKTHGTPELPKHIQSLQDDIKHAVMTPETSTQA